VTSVDRTNTGFRRRKLVATAIALIGLGCAANAFADADPVDLKLMDRETGRELRVWRHHGRLFVAGEPGERYELRVTNHTDGRVLVVLSVDGVNIITGETAKYDQRGYVLDAYSSYEASGWRKSNTEVATFAFAPLPQSYAARTGRPSDVGVIGMAVFREWAALQDPEPVVPAMRPQWRDESRRGDSGAADADAARLATPAPTAGFRALPVPGGAPKPPLLYKPPARPVVPGPSIAAAPNQVAAGGGVGRRDDPKLGTAHGAREWSVVNTTTFVRATPYPEIIRQIEYDTVANLVASGVISPSPYAERRPRAFPFSPGETGFVRDPPIEP